MLGRGVNVTMGLEKHYVTCHCGTKRKKKKHEETKPETLENEFDCKDHLLATWDYAEIAKLRASTMEGDQGQDSIW